MIVVPNEKPVATNLNSYYLNLEKLVEHYQGEIGAGCIHLKAPSIEATIFFDKDQFLNGVVQNRGGNTRDGEVMDYLLDASQKYNFVINVYRIDSGGIYFWASMVGAEEVYRELKSEFTDFEGLLKKMQAEKLSGYIDVAIDNGKEKGLIFFSTGKIVGGSYSWANGSESGMGNLKTAIQKVKDGGGVFNVKKNISKRRKEEKLVADEQEATVETEADTQKEDQAEDVIDMMEPVLAIFERVIQENKKAPRGFKTLLRKKCVEKADIYDFLDPFAGEFDYVDNKIIFAGQTNGDILAKGIVECVKELAEELRLKPKLMEALTPWLQKYSGDLKKLGVTF